VLAQLIDRNLDAVSPFAVFIKGILDFLDNLSLQQIRSLFNLFSALALGRANESFWDELHIVIRKQLSNGAEKYKRIGVIGSIAALRSLGRIGALDSTGKNNLFEKHTINALLVHQSTQDRRPKAADRPNHRSCRPRASSRWS